MSIDVFTSFPFGFEGRIWDLIVSVPDHCLSFYCMYFARRYNHSSTCMIQAQLYVLIRCTTPHIQQLVQLLMSSRGFSLLIRVVIYQNVHLDE